MEIVVEGYKYVGEKAERLSKEDHHLLASRGTPNAGSVYRLRSPEENFWMIAIVRSERQLKEDGFPIEALRGEKTPLHPRLIEQLIARTARVARDFSGNRLRNETHYGSRGALIREDGSMKEL